MEQNEQVKYYAHTAELPDGSRDYDERHWQPLATHLYVVADLASNAGIPLVLATLLLDS